MVAQFIVTLFMTAFKEHIKKKFSKDNRQELINKLNKEVDIPFINEKTEEKGIRVLLKIIEKYLLK
tara:strand:+ start:1993 stop:2190 length:198 start_codon:yes stop_codon:yes gene_type:complete